MPRSASASNVAVSGSADGRTSDDRRESTSCAGLRATSQRRSRQAAAIESSTWRKLGSPCRGSGGKYVPP